MNFQKIKKSLLFIPTLGIVVCVIAGGWVKGWWIPNSPNKKQFPVRGIDVSHHNGDIGWKAVASQNYRFAYIKATEGSDWRDKRFLEHWENSGKSGVTRGAYHFFSPYSTGGAQAENFIAVVPRESGTLPPVIDAEFSKEKSGMDPAQFHKELSVLFDALARHYGVTPVIYTTREFHDNYLTDKHIKILWVREILKKPSGWAANWTFWQYSGRGTVKGITGRVDLNVFKGNESEFRAFLSN